jgi:hypothetical protein
MHVLEYLRVLNNVVGMSHSNLHHHHEMEPATLLTSLFLNYHQPYIERYIILNHQNTHTILDGDNMKEKIPKTLRTPLLFIGVICIAMICVSMSGCVQPNGQPIISINLGGTPTVTPTPIEIVTPPPTPIWTPAPTRVPTTIRTVATPYPTVDIAPINIGSSGRSDWITHRNYVDRFSINKPYDWTVTTLPKTSVTNEPIIMDEFVYLYTPSMKGFILIYGADMSGTVGALYSDGDNTKISNTLYDTFIRGVKSGFTPDNPLKLVEVVKDSNYYMINGNPARHMLLRTQANGQSLDGDFYLIANGNSYYVEGYMGMYGSSIADEKTAAEIMQTFRTL